MNGWSICHEPSWTDVWQHLMTFQCVWVYRYTWCIFMCVDSWIWKFETEEGARIADVRRDMASIAQSWRQGNLQEMQLRVSMSIRQSSFWYVCRQIRSTLISSSLLGDAFLELYSNWTVSSVFNESTIPSKHWIGIAQERVGGDHGENPEEGLCQDVPNKSIFHPGKWQSFSMKQRWINNFCWTFHIVLNVCI